MSAARQSHAGPDGRAPTRFTRSEMDRIKALPISDIASRLQVGPLRKSGRNLIGACPLCGGGKGAGRFELKLGENAFVCAVCQEGGDVIRLVERVCGVGFVDAVSWLGGRPDVEPAPGEARAVPAKVPGPDKSEAFRERERRKLWTLYGAALAGPGSPLVSYCEIRRIDPLLLTFAPLRYAPELAYYHGDVEDPDSAKPAARRPRIIHVGPAMLAPYVRPDGRFGGLHITWLDLDKPKGKAQIVDPDTGVILLARKVRGSKRGGRIDLVRAPGATRMFAGEGIETVGVVWTAFRAMGRDATGLWSSGLDMGNLGGKATASLPHPNERTPKGRPLRVPGPDPDMSEPAMPVPDAIADLVLLGDGDSDPFTTCHAMTRAATRHARPGRMIRIAWADRSKDFGDMAMPAISPGHGGAA
jgi:hypothetical protein